MFGFFSVNIVFLCVDSRVSIGPLRDKTKTEEKGVAGNRWEKTTKKKNITYRGSLILLK